ncbi:MAG: hypothetical protein LC734_09470 [Acidobacteria bacterium]|nr:hypothetical protein [Acidobacteriota bacterium]
MQAQATHPSVIFLMDAQQTTDRDEMKEWFASGDFRSCEAENIFDALESISDYTVAERPDVVFLEVESPTRDFNALSELIGDSAVAEQLSVISMYDDDSEKGNLETLDEMKARLEPLLAHQATA